MVTAASSCRSVLVWTSVQVCDCPLSIINYDDAPVKIIVFTSNVYGITTGNGPVLRIEIQNFFAIVLGKEIQLFSKQCKKKN